MLVFLFLIGVLVAAVIYLLKHRPHLQLRQFLHTLRTHWLMSGLLLIYSALCGVVLFTGFTSSLEAFLLVACPFLAGGCAGWWELRRDASRPHEQRIVSHGILAGLTATALPVLILVLSTMVDAWRAGELVEASGWWTAPWLESLFWGAALFGLGIILSVVGALIGTLIAQHPIPPYHRGPTGPSARR